MDGPRDQFLAGSCLPRDQNGGIGRRDLGDPSKHGLQRRRSAHDLLEHGCLVNLLTQRDVLSVELVPQRLNFFESLLQTAFGALATLYIGTCAIPPHDATLFIPQRIVSNQEPAVLPVLPPDSRLQLKRGTVGKCSLSKTFQLLQIFRMEDSG